MESLYRWLGLDLAGVDVSKFREPENSTPEVFRMPAWNGIARKLWQSPPVKVVKPYLSAGGAGLAAKSDEPLRAPAGCRHHWRQLSSCGQSSEDRLTS